METEFIAIIEDAARAPSGHNTQPWKFEVQKSKIILRPDFKRRLKVVDPDDHALFISLGCALENLILSAKAHGYSPRVSKKFLPENDELVVDLVKSDKVEKDILYDFIGQRQCTRSGYEPNQVDPSVLEQLKEQVYPDYGDILYFTDRKKINELEPFIIEGSDHQFNNKEFVNELVSWLRFNKQAAKKAGDGVWSSSMGLPNIPNSLGNLIMKNLVSAKSEAKRWQKLIGQTSGFALFVANGNTKADWVMLGQGFQRFGLKATQLGLKHAHVNMPCEEISVREKLMSHFNIPHGKQALLLVRFGYGEVMPYSFRLPVQEVLKENDIVSV